MIKIEKWAYVAVCIFALGFITSLYASDQPSGDIFPGATGQQGSSPSITPPAHQDQTPAVPTPAPAPTPNATPQNKIAPPSPAAIKAAMAAVNDAYATDLAGTKTPEQTAALVKKLLDAAKDEKDSANRFALFTKARDVAIQGNDFTSASAAIDAMDAIFTIDALEMDANAATAIAKTVRGSEQQRGLVNGIVGVIDRAMVVDRYDIAKPLADAALGVARLTDDADLVRQIAAKIQQLRETQSAYLAIKPSMDILASKPNDPDANLAAGVFRCFIKADWNTGLPKLALGGDTAIKALANSELQKPTDASAQMTLADGWWDISQKQTGIAKTSIQSHAAIWYAQAAPNLTGLAKAKADARLQIIADSGPARTIDLLKMVDVEKNSVEGKWELQNGTLVSDASKYSKIEFLYQPPAEYDYRIEFCRTAGNDDVALICWAAGHHFSFNIGAYKNKIMGFQVIDGKGADKNPTGRKSVAWLANGTRHSVLIKVRTDRVLAYFDGELAAVWKTDYTDMNTSENWQLRQANTIGLGSARSPTIFYSAEVIEVTGHGQEVK